MQSRFFADPSAAAEGRYGLVHGDHAVPAAGSDDAIDLVVLVIPNEAAHRAVAVQDLAGGNQTAMDIRKQLLGDHSLQHRCQLDPDLGLLGAGEGIDDPVNGIDRTLGVQCGNDQMARFRCGHGSMDGFRIPHFPQQDHIRRLPDAGPKGAEVIFGVDGDFPLADDAAAVPVQKFDGILQCDDVAVPIPVDPVDAKEHLEAIAKYGPCPIHRMTFKGVREHVR